jgi:hypothetical protein
MLTFAPHPRFFARLLSLLGLAALPVQAFVVQSHLFEIEEFVVGGSYSSDSFLEINLRWDQPGVGQGLVRLDTFSLGASGLLYDLEVADYPELFADLQGWSSLRLDLGPAAGTVFYGVDLTGAESAILSVDRFEVSPHPENPAVDILRASGGLFVLDEQILTVVPEGSHLALLSIGLLLLGIVYRRRGQAGSH